MSEQCENISVRVSFICKFCGVLFKCVSTYFTHKVKNHHSIEFLHNKSLVFEESESNLELNENKPAPGGVESVTEYFFSFHTSVAENEWQNTQLNNLDPIEVKKEPPAPVIFSSEYDTGKSTANSSNTYHVNLLPLQNDDCESELDESTHISGFKTEWVEDTLVIYETPSQNNDPKGLLNSGNNLQKNKDYKDRNNYNATETLSSFIGSDTDMDLSHGHVHEVDKGPDPLENFDLTQSSQSTSTLTTREMEQEYFNEIGSDSDDEVICLDDSPPPPSTPNKIASSTEPTATATTSVSNSFILSQLKLQCHICSKQFTSSAQLGIHVTICELYNGKIKESTAAEPAQLPARVRSRIRSRSRTSHSSVKQKSSYSKRNNFVNCEECSIKVRRCNLNAHLRTEHKIFVEELDRKYVCNSCGSAFRSKSDLQRHARVHSDEKPFVCSFQGCYDSFKAGETLKHHQKTNHPQLFGML